MIASVLEDVLLLAYRTKSIWWVYEAIGGGAIQAVIECFHVDNAILAMLASCFLHIMGGLDYYGKIEQGKKNDRPYLCARDESRKYV